MLAEVNSRFNNFIACVKEPTRPLLKKELDCVLSKVHQLLAKASSVSDWLSVSGIAYT